MSLKAAFVNEDVTNLQYPHLPNIRKGWSWMDEFMREALLPANGYTFYTVAVNGAGTGVVNVGRQLLMTTAATATNDVDVRVSGVTIQRTPDDLTTQDQRTTVTMLVRFIVGTATSVEGFIGLEDLQAQLSAIPTTVRHLGLFWNISADANFFFTSANGTDQVTADTGVAVAAAAFTLRIIWTGNDAATIELLDSNQAVLATEVVTAIAMAGETMTPHFFVETETSAARTLTVNGWGLSFG